MILRLATLALALLTGACTGGGGVATGPAVRFPQWARERRDDGNTGTGASLATNRGKQKWISPDLGSAVSTAPAVGIDGVVYVGTEAGTIFALDPSDGSVRWQFPSAPDRDVGAIRGAPALDVLEQVYFGTEQGWVLSVDSSGRERWCFATGARGPCDAAAPPGAAVRTSSVFEFDSADQRERVLFFGAADGVFYSIDAASGTLRWLFETRPPAAIDASPARDINGTLYALAADGTLYAWSRTGSLALRFSLGAASSAPAPPSIALTTVFQLIARDGSAEVVALNPDATVLWRTAVGREVRAALTQWTRDTPDGPRSEIVAVAADGSVLSLEQRTGQMLGVCRGGDADGLACKAGGDCDSGHCESALFVAPDAVAAPPVASSNGVLVVATSGQAGSGAVYAVAPRVCRGGDRNREPCRFDADCPGNPPGTCDPGDRVCLAGTRAGTSCAADADCGEGAGLCMPPDRFCTTQLDYGLPCASDADCAGGSSGSCRPATRLCLGGERHGEPCESDDACSGSISGTCTSRALRVVWRFTGRFCDGGTAGGQACAGDGECEGGRCSGEPLGAVTSSPAIAADGTLYFGAGRRVYAVGG